MSALSAAQDIFRKNKANGNILEEVTKALRCATCDRFLADRFVEVRGTVTQRCGGFCHVHGAGPLPQVWLRRCAWRSGALSCGLESDHGAVRRVRQAAERHRAHRAQVQVLQEQVGIWSRSLFYCAIVLSCILSFAFAHGGAALRPEVVDSKHLFLDLPKITPRAQAWFKESSVTGKWSTNSIATTDAWFKDGLQPRCITRDLRWGTPVPAECGPEYAKKARADAHACLVLCCGFCCAVSCLCIVCL